MFNIGGSEMILLLALGLLVFGADGLPELIRTSARTVQAFRKVVQETTSELHRTLRWESQKRETASRRRQRSLRARQTLEAPSEPDPSRIPEPRLHHGGLEPGHPSLDDLTA